MLEWKKLGEVISVHTGSQLNRNDMLEQGVYPVINGGRTPSGYTNEPNEKSNSITISQGGESAGFVNWMDCDFWAGAHCYVVECLDDTIKRYVFHFLKNSEYELMSSKQGAGIPGLNRKNLYKLVIPVPSITEQTRIVGILDTFTASIENLKQQIAQRRKQYEHYRDQLLDLEGKEGVEMKTLGEVCDKTGNIKWKNETDDACYRYIDLSSVSIESHIIGSASIIKKSNAPSRAQQVVKEGDVLLGTTRPTLKRFCLVTQEFDNQICSTGFCVFRANRVEVNEKWIYHNIGCNRFWNYCELKQQGAGYPCLSNTDAFLYYIPVPSLPEQQRIVSILDTFEASIANLEQQLAQREKQYEYYRNKLLKFD